jgi:protein SCO1
MNRNWRIGIIAVSVLAGSASALLYTRGREAPMLTQATRLDAPRSLPALALIDHEGRPFGASRLRGHWTLLFFGFTNCPDVCPTTLAMLAAARESLADLPKSERPEVVLVTVDPARDTPAVLARYVTHFDPTFTGVTGEASAIELLTRELGVAVMIAAPSADGSYAVDHTAAIFLIDPDAAWIALFGAPHSAATIAADYRALIHGRSLAP